MKKTNFTNSHLSDGARAIRRLSLVLSCLAITALLGLSQAFAQTADEAGELEVANFTELILEETLALRAEMGDPAPGVDIEHNPVLMQFYEKVSKNWTRDGLEFKAAWENNLHMISTRNASGPSSVFSSASGGSSVFINSKSQVAQLLNLVEAVDFEDNSDEDIHDIFDYLRTLKNS